MKKYSAKKVVVTILSLLFIFAMIISVSACGNKPKDPSDSGNSGNGEVTETEIYEKAFEKLATHIKNNAQIDQTFDQSHGYSYVNVYTNTEELLREYSMDLIYMDMFSSDDAINFEWYVKKTPLGTDTLSMTISQKIARSVKIEWTSGVTGNVGIFYVEPNNTYKNTNVMFTDYDFNNEFYGFVVDPDSESAQNAMMADERYATEELSYFLEISNQVLSDEANVTLKDFGFSKIGQETKYSQALKIIDFEKGTVNLKVGEKYLLSYIVYPYFIEGKETLFSSDKNIVSVTNEGIVSGVGKGHATITLQAGTLKKEFQITVREKNNVDYAREFFEANDGQRFDLQGNKISTIKPNEAFYEISCFDLESGERMYMINYFSNAASYKKLDVINSSLSMSLGKESENIADEFLKSIGTYAVCTSNGMANRDVTAFLGLELGVSGKIVNCKFEKTAFYNALGPAEGLQYLNNMVGAANKCLDGLKLILAKNANAYFDINAQPSLIIKDTMVTKDSAAFSYELSSYFNEHIISAEIYKDGKLVKNCTNELIGGEKIDGLYSGTTYTLKVKCEYNKNDGLGNRSMEQSVTFRTDTVPMPDFDVNISTTESTADITFLSKNLTPYTVSKIILYKNGSAEKTLTENNVGWKFADLMSDTAYSAEITYSYDLEDGNGLQTKTKTVSFHTQQYVDPSVTLTVESDYRSANYEITSSNTSNVKFNIVKIDLYKGENFIKNLGKEISGTVSELLADNEYRLEITYNFDKNDGKGVQTRMCQEVFKTLKYTRPSFQHTSDSTYDSISYVLNVSAVSEVNYQLNKIEVWKDNTFIASTQKISDTVSELLSDNDYTVKVCYLFDLQNGDGVQNDIYSFTVHTQNYMTPSADITVNQFNDREVMFAVDFNDPDQKGHITKVELKVDDKIVSTLTEFTDLSALTMSGLQANDVFDIVVTYGYDLLDGKGQCFATNEISATNSKFIYDKSTDKITIKGICEQYTDEITTLEIPDSLEGIRNIVIQSLQFARQNKVEKLIIADSITEISFEAFKGYINLQSVTLPFIGAQRGGTNNTFLGYIFGATSYSGNTEFLPVSLITKVVVPDSVTSIGMGAFKGCNSIEDITLPFVGNSLNAAYHDAVFGYIFGYESRQVTKDSNSSDGDDHYSLSPETSNQFINAHYIPIPVGTTWQYSGKANYRLKSYHYYIPTTIKQVTITVQTNIPIAAFNNCDFIKTIVLPTETESIGEYAFQNCLSLKRLNSDTDGVLNIPNGVTVVSDYMFNQCVNVAR